MEALSIVGYTGIDPFPYKSVPEPEHFASVASSEHSIVRCEKTEAGTSRLTSGPSPAQGRPHWRMN